MPRLRALGPQEPQPEPLIEYRPPATAVARSQRIVVQAFGKAGLDLVRRDLRFAPHAAETSPRALALSRPGLKKKGKFSKIICCAVLT